jgi:DNA-binding response OmpR family regulator
MKPKVLVVDDEVEFAQLTEYNLSRQGFEVHTALSGVEALHQARRVLPDVILLDLLLPDLDGDCVSEILHSQPSTAGVPIVVVSALDRTGATRAGTNLHFQKPVAMDVLGDCLRGLCAQQRRMFERACDDDGEGATREPLPAGE